MIVPFVFAIWFGLRAAKQGRFALVWALVGAALSFAVGTIIVNITVLMSTGRLDATVSVSSYLGIRILALAVTIPAMVGLGLLLLPADPAGTEARLQKKLRKRSHARTQSRTLDPGAGLRRICCTHCPRSFAQPGPGNTCPYCGARQDV